MEKNAIESFKNQYVKLVKDTGETLNGAIVEIMDDDVIFQTEIARQGIAMRSIRDITLHTVKKRAK